CHIHSFQERDIDLLIAEELRVNTAFAEWFVHQAAPYLSLKGTAVRTRVSVVEDGSESDVIACFRDGNGRIHRIFIEDKITAPMMPKQLERYLRRAEAELLRSEVTGFSVVLFAPAAYSATLPDGVTSISFEDAADALRKFSNDPRSAYRAAFLDDAVPTTSVGERDIRIVETDPYIADWWDKVYLMLDREFPGFFLPPQIQYPRSVYFSPRTSAMPNYLRVDLKGHLGEVDLAFKNLPVKSLTTGLAGLEAPGQLIENSKSSALRITDLAPFQITDGYKIIETHVRTAYAAAATLLTYWSKHQEVFDRLIVRNERSQGLS
ncbi:MAG: hypothetical protein KUG59_05665, partial [Parvibaculaceae bacterium]|nr:hypothetical protein [Parvibaculaceae bacterium]